MDDRQVAPLVLDTIYECKQVWKAFTSLGVEQLLTASGFRKGGAGTSLYLIVAPEHWNDILETPSEHYPYWLLHAYSLLDTFTTSIMQSVRMQWRLNEPLGISRLIRKNAAPEYVNDETDEGNLRATAMIINDIKGFGADKRFLNAGHIDLDAFLAGEGEYDGWMPMMLRELEWWKSADPWVDVAVLPSGNGRFVSEADVRASMYVTHFGWNVIEPTRLSFKYERVQRDLARAFCLNLNL